MQDTVYKMVQTKILDMLAESEKTGMIRWVRPWQKNCPLPKSLITENDVFYSGCNAILLEPGEYCTWNQICQMQQENPDKQIKLHKGARAETVFYFNFVQKKDADGNPELDEDGNPKKIPFLKFYKVFSIASIDGVESRMPYNEVEHTLDETMEKAELYLKTYCQAMGVNLVIKKGMQQAYFDPNNDTIVIPDKSQFQSIRRYFGVCFHECCHYIDKYMGLTTKRARNQQDAEMEFKQDPYSDGELLAEIGSALICNMLYISDDDTMRNSSEYIKGWSRKVAEERPSYIVSMSGRAWKAAQHFMDVVQMELLKQQAKEQEELVVKAEDKYIHMWVNEDGDYEYDIHKFDILQEMLKQVDGGIIETGQEIQNLYDALSDILEDYNISEKNIEAIDVDEFMEIISGDVKYQEWEESR